MKPCPRCGEIKPFADFSIDRKRKDGLNCYCRSCRAHSDREYAESHPESSRRRSRRYAERHPERAKAAMDRWRARNPEWSAENNRKWREANPDGWRRWYAANQDKVRAGYDKRRALKLAASVGEVDLDALWVANDGCCQLCGDQIDRTIKAPLAMSASVDHIVPLSRGGSHEQSNLQWTHLVCNKRKGAKLPADFQSAPSRKE